MADETNETRQNTQQSGIQPGADAYDNAPRSGPIEEDFATVSSIIATKDGDWATELAIFGVLAAACWADGHTAPAETEEFNALIMRIAALSDPRKTSLRIYDETGDTLPTQVISPLLDAVRSVLAQAKARAEAGGADEPEALRKGLEHVAQAGGSALSDDRALAASVYAHAYDLALADQVLDPREVAFLDTVASALALPSAIVEELHWALDVKNRRVAVPPAPPQVKRAKRGLLSRLFFGRATEPAQAPEWSQEDAAVALLIGACLADGLLVAEERAAFHALLVRIRRPDAPAGGAVATLVTRFDMDRLDALSERVQALINSDGIDALAHAAARVLGGEEALGLSLYAHCLDLVMADKIVRPSEQTFLKVLAQAFSLPQPACQRLTRALATKNEAGLGARIAALAGPEVREPVAPEDIKDAELTGLNLRPGDAP